MITADPIPRHAYTVKEAAAAVGRSRSFVLEAIRRGDLLATPMRHGRERQRTTWLIPTACLERWVLGDSQ